MKLISERAPQSGWESWMPEYWLCHCEGFKVETRSGDHLGFVEEVVWSSDYSFVDALVVRRGFDSDGKLTLPVENVVSIRPEASLIEVARP